KSAPAHHQHRLIGSSEIFGDHWVGGGDSAGQAAKGGQNQSLFVARKAGARHMAAADVQPQLGVEMPRHFGPGFVNQTLVPKDDAVDDMLVSDLAAPRAAGQPVM